MAIKRRNAARHAVGRDLGICVLLTLTILAVFRISSHGAALNNSSHIVYLPAVSYRPREIVFGAGSTYDNPLSIERLRADWTYDWSAFPTNYARSEDVPMTYGARALCGPDYVVGTGTPCVCQPLGGDSIYVLGPNEPDDASSPGYIPEADMGILLHAMRTCYPDLRLIGPGTEEIAYQQDMLAAYVDAYDEPPPLHGLALHCYGDWDNVDTAILKCTSRFDSLAELADEYGIPELWLTEFAYIGWMSYDDARAIAFMEAIVDYARDLPERFAIQRVRLGFFEARYLCTESWAFGPDRCTTLTYFDDDPLVDQTLTPLGQRYVELIAGEP